MVLVALALVALALVGHAAFWVGLVNRWHATGFRRRVVKTVVLAFYGGLILLPPAVLWTLVDERSGFAAIWTGDLNWAKAYGAFCAAYGAMHIPLWGVQRWRMGRLPECVQLRQNRVVDVACQLGFEPACGLRTRLFCRVPGNQLWQLHVSEFDIAVPRLAEPLQALSVCHWSDLHFSGRIDRGYFREVVRLTNAMHVDLIALTGDVCDKAYCIPWIPELLGQAQARLGKLFVLGNHDLRTKDVARLRAGLVEAGFSDVGGRQEAVDGGRILIAGNERPWFNAPQSAIDATFDPAEEQPLKILLSHTPDHLGWARAQRFDLMLAGHTHGGQIRFPWIGPVICPSWHGTKYAAGFFHEHPTVLHVSRGTASLMPLRILCPPEITKLVLRAESTAR